MKQPFCKQYTVLPVLQRNYFQALAPWYNYGYTESVYTAPPWKNTPPRKYMPPRFFKIGRKVFGTGARCKNEPT